jgi:hypothetical protein
LVAVFHHWDAMLFGKDSSPRLITCRNGVDDDLRMAFGRTDKGHGTVGPESACVCLYRVTDTILAAPRIPNLSASSSLGATGGLR